MKVKIFRDIDDKKLKRKLLKEIKKTFREVR